MNCNNVMIYLVVYFINSGLINLDELHFEVLEIVLKLGQGAIFVSEKLVSVCTIWSCSWYWAGSFI